MRRMLLFAHRWREEARSLFGWTITAGLMSFAVVLFASVFIDLGETARLLEEWLAKAPPALRGLFGGEAAIANALVRFVLGAAFNAVIPALVLVYVSLAVAGIYTREASRGNLEFLFSLPVERLHLVVGRILVFLVDLAVVHLAIYLGAGCGLLAAGARMEMARTALALLNQYFLFACLGGLVFLISLSSTDYTKVLLVAFALFFGLFALNITQEGKEGLLYRLNPYHYYRAMQVIAGASPWRDCLVLAVAAIIAWTVGVRLYIRKQI
ncbi:MAG: hypothetical protein ACUVRM_06575 [Bacillota bacterium]